MPSYLTMCLVCRLPSCTLPMASESPLHGIHHHDMLQISWPLLCTVVCSCTQRLSVCLLCSTIIPEIQATAKPPVVKVWLDYGQMSMWSGLTLSLSLLLAFLDFESELHSLQTMNKAIWMLYVELAALYLPSAVSLRCHLAV